MFGPLRRLLPFVIALLLAWALASAARAQDSLTVAAHTRDSLVTAWMKQNARPFDTCEPGERTDDLRALRDIVGKARIVGLGEGTHGTREFFQMKHRSTQYLATNMGFSVFAIEANLPEAWKLNDYVLGGPGDAKKLIDGMYFWTWNTEEVLAMVEWMRRFNASKRGHIEFTGFDMQIPDTAASIVRRCLDAHDTAWVDTLRAIGRAAARDPGFVTSTGGLPVRDFAGHHVRYSGWIRTDHVTQFTGLWMRADTPEKNSAAFDNMAGQQVRGTTDWKRYAIELDIPSATSNINFGCLTSGEGRAWFDSLAIEVDGHAWNDGSVDLALEEADGPRGFSRVMPGGRFAIAMDDSAAKCGARSLRLAAGPKPAAGGASTEGIRAAAAARALVDHLEGSRAAIAAATSPAQADWIVRNAHVVLQSSLMKSASFGTYVRDSCMAANVEWIADQARKGAKIVIWAHNAHVSKQPLWLGSHLAKYYGSDYVAIGFAAGDGQYTAIADGALSHTNELQPPPAGSIEACARGTSLPRFLLDVRRAAAVPAVATPLRQGMLLRSIGAGAMKMQFQPAPLPGYYDALLWVDHTTASRAISDATGDAKK